MQLWMRGDWVEIRRSDITLKEKLGEGAFGEAYKGLVRLDGKVRECAVKKLKGKDSNLSICQSGKCFGFPLDRAEGIESLFFEIIFPRDFKIIIIL